jgi:hypothetical protein
MALSSGDNAFGNTPPKPQLAACDSPQPKQQYRIGLIAYGKELQCMLLTWRATNCGTGVLHVRADGDTD